MRKKILFIITKSEMGGAQRFLYELVTHLDPEKYDVSVAAGRAYRPASPDPLRQSDSEARLQRGKQAGGKEELFDKLALKNVKTIKIRNFSNMPGVKNLLAFFEIFWLITKTRPDVIYLLSSEAGFSGSIAGSFYKLLSRSPRWPALRRRLRQGKSFGEAGKKIKIIYRIGGWAFKEPRNIIIKKIYLWAEKISAPFKDIIIVNSEFDRQLAIKNKIASPHKIITIYNGSDINELKFLPKKTACQFLFRKTDPPSEPIIGTIANFYKNKSLDTLILAAARIKVMEKSWNFIIIGEGPERKKLENLIKKHGLENNIILTGAIRDAYQYLRAFDVFVLSSIKEGQPWAILEAMAAGVPIVATNIAGIPEMIENEKSGLLVEPADSKTLAEAMMKMITHPSLANECAKNALAIVKEKFSISDMIKKNEDLL